MGEEPKAKESPKRRRFLLEALKGGLPVLASLWTGQKLAPPAETPRREVPEPELPKPQVPADLKNELDESYEEFKRANPDYSKES